MLVEAELSDHGEVQLEAYLARFVRASLEWTECRHSAVGAFVEVLRQFDGDHAGHLHVVGSAQRVEVQSQEALRY